MHGERQRFNLLQEKDFDNHLADTLETIALATVPEQQLLWAGDVIYQRQGPSLN